MNLLSRLIAIAIILNSCLRGNDSLVDVEDGIYIKGKSTAFNHYDVNGQMKPAVNEVTGLLREGLYEIFIAVSSESDGFSIIEVNDKTPVTLGPLSKDNIVLNGENDQITAAIQKGTFGHDEDVFTVPEDGVYHIIIDKQSSTYIISPVSDVSFFCHQNGEVWVDTDIPLAGSFDKVNIMYEITGLNLTECEFRLRYGHGNKIEILNNDVKVHTSFGGTFSGSVPALTLSMIPGGNNYDLISGMEGTYTVNVIWSVGEGFIGQMTETGSSSYPEKLFMIGDGISPLAGDYAWNWDSNDYEMVPTYSLPHLFWKIIWLNGSGTLRFAPQKAWENDFGKEGSETNGLFNIGGEDMPVPATAGYHMVVINLQTEQISVTRPAVYLIGDVVGSWDTQNPGALFSNYDSFDVIYLKRKLDAGIVRMYAAHDKGWFTHWWNTELNVNNSVIKFLGNGSTNLQPVDITAGVYEIKLNFRTGEGSIVRCTTCD